MNREKIKQKRTLLKIKQGLIYLIWLFLWGIGGALGPDQQFEFFVLLVGVSVISLASMFDILTRKRELDKKENE